MSSVNDQKLKLLYTYDYLLHNSDESHPVTIYDIIGMLSGYGLECDRRTVTSNIEALTTYGLDIVETRTGHKSGYYIASQTFEMPELKLLVDSIQSSKFITQKKTLSLIKKIETLTSVYNAQQLNRQVYVFNRVKTMNESVYYNIDKIHNAIDDNVQIKFHYIEHDIYKQKRFRKNGQYYKMSPFSLTCDNENYYLIVFDAGAGVIKHFRVDKMSDIVLLSEPRYGQEVFLSIDLGMYSKQVFGMFAGKAETIKLRFTNSLIDAVLDRLGYDITLIPDGDEHFTVTTDIVSSPQFYAWLCGFGKGVQIISPEKSISDFKNYLDGIMGMY